MLSLIFGLIVITVLPIVVGVVLALLALIPALHSRARQSPQYRHILIITLSVIALAVLFAGITYLNAITAKIIPAISGGPTYFLDDDESNALLTQELWYQAMIPPWMQSDSTCITEDSAVCEVAQELRNFDSLNTNPTTGYMQLLVFVLIATTTCGFSVHYVTRDHRKEKQKSEQVI